MAAASIEFQGRPAVRLELPDGTSCTIALHGAHVLSWITAEGIERLYLSPEARFDGRSAIRGGVPVCWPQFNQRGPLPKHGFARTMAWQLADSGTVDSGDGCTAALALRDTEATRAIWPYAFAARLTVKLAPRSLHIALDIENTGNGALSFTAALHTYLRVADIATAALQGLAGASRWDAVRDVHENDMAPELRFGAEFDCVYQAAATPLRLVQPSGALEIAQSANCTETVVW
ncbi:MAG: D-hexose-6-phosphate mutarotase, partial [Gammaproteobacteria bacterium]|nr:D-hexose-6-phosphate mutarotase [Gammaproteobacteria bacterium]MBU1443351.1 D-hexose-6-phosphate mutarotase [Gammaproteobacteria bacterium]